MGFVRFALALIVVVFHTGITVGIGGLAAVQAFFILFGLYMAAAYRAKYAAADNGRSSFYINRVLRLWPTYLILLGLTTAFAMLPAQVVKDPAGILTFFRSHDISEKLFALPFNLFLFGQDFLSVDSDWHMLLPVRQSWSIATELTFYLIVPLVFARRVSPVMGLAVVVTSAVFKAILLTRFGWRAAYFLPLCNMGYFFLGSLIYCGSKSALVLTLRKRRLVRLGAPAGVIAVLFAFGRASFEQAPLMHAAFVPLFSVAVMVAFGKPANALDDLLGNISYGVYLNHLLLIDVIASTVGFHVRTWTATVTVALASVGLAIVIEACVQRPIDRFRRSLVHKGRVAGQPYSGAESRTADVPV